MSMHMTHYFVTCPKMVVWILIFINNHHHRHPTMTLPTLSVLDAYIGYSHIPGGNHDLLVGWTPGLSELYIKRMNFEEIELRMDREISHTEVKQSCLFNSFIDWG